MYDAPVSIGHYLELDVVRVDDEFLDVDVAISERLFGLQSCAVKGGDETWLVMRGAHAAPAATRHGFDHHRVSDFFRDLSRLFFVIHHPITSRCDWNPGFARGHPGGVLVAHQTHRVRRRTDKLYVAAFAYFGEVRVLGEKPVAGMNGIDIADFRRAHDPVDFQIAVRTRWRADANRLVGQLEVERLDVRFGVN